MGGSYQGEARRIPVEEQTSFSSNFRNGNSIGSLPVAIRILSASITSVGRRVLIAWSPTNHAESRNKKKVREKNPFCVLLLLLRYPKSLSNYFLLL